MGGNPDLPKPGKYKIEIHKDGIQILQPLKSNKVFVPNSQITDVSVSYDVKDKSLSVGKAIAGDLIAGPLGAIAGAAMGSKKVEPHLVISQKDASGQVHQFVLVTKQAEKIQKKIQKHLS